MVAADPGPCGVPILSGYTRAPISGNDGGFVHLGAGPRVWCLSVDTIAAAQSARGASGLLQRYLEVRGLTESLAAPLSAEDQTVQSMPDVSPTKWHRAHTTWFFETFVLGPDDPDYRVYHPEFAYLFNSYYEAIGPRYPRNRRGLVTRPGCEEVAGYRRYADDAMASWLEKGGSQLGRERTELGLHHEQQHQELLLMDIKHVLSMTSFAPAYVQTAIAGPSPVPEPGWSRTREAWSRSATTGTVSLSTTKARRTASFCSRSLWPTGWLRAANG